MKEITYSILCEDNAHKIFIETILRKLNNDKFQFLFNHIFYKKLLCRNSKDVLNKMVQAVDYSFLQSYGFFVDILFIGIDYDDRPRENFNAGLDKLYQKFDNKGREKAIIFFPVQAIEHWLLFAKRKKDNPGLTKNIGDEIEKIERKTAKEILYGNEVQSRNEIIVRLVENVDLPWLSIQSKSFNLFYQKLSKKLVL